jgi:hypothetical protein
MAEEQHGLLKNKIIRWLENSMACRRIKGLDGRRTAWRA